MIQVVALDLNNYIVTKDRNPKQFYNLQKITFSFFKFTSFI